MFDVVHNMSATTRGSCAQHNPVPSVHTNCTLLQGCLVVLPGVTASECITGKPWPGQADPVHSA
jgi:hypothetical protein